MLLAVSFVSTNRASAQTIQSNFLVVATGNQIQIQQINPSTAWTECLACSPSLIAWCSVTCVINSVVDKIAASSSEDVEIFQVVRYDNGTFAAFNRLGQNMTGYLPTSLIFDWGNLSSGRDALLNALAAS
jgi:hypothetical protein